LPFKRSNPRFSAVVVDKNLDYVIVDFEIVEIWIKPSIADSFVEDMVFEDVLLFLVSVT
jgi:hypothetical protein